MQVYLGETPLFKDYFEVEVSSEEPSSPRKHRKSTRREKSTDSMNNSDVGREKKRGERKRGELSPRKDSHNERAGAKTAPPTSKRLHVYKNLKGDE